MTTTDKLVEMLTRQHALQQRHGYDFPAMTVNERIEFIKDMMLATHAELNEALDEVTWKPWTARTYDEIKALPFVAELGDAFQFIMNMWFAAFPHMSPEDLAYAMLTGLTVKIDINDTRRTTGVAEKCHVCKRALDDPAVSCYRRGDQGFCAETGSSINYIKTR